jgi:hypothetical protein
LFSDRNALSNPDRISDAKAACGETVGPHGGPNFGPPSGPRPRRPAGPVGRLPTPFCETWGGGRGVKEIAPLDTQTGSNKYTFSCLKNKGTWSRIVRRPQTPPQRTRHHEAHIRALASLMVLRGGGLSGAGQRYSRAPTRSAGLAFGTRSVRPLTITADRNCSSDCLQRYPRAVSRTAGRSGFRTAKPSTLGSWNHSLHTVFAGWWTELLSEWWGKGGWQRPTDLPTLYHAHGAAQRLRPPRAPTFQSSDWADG